MEIFEQNLEQTESKMRAVLGELIPDIEYGVKADLVYQINRLKREKNAIILGHNYMEPALYHSVADVTGDSLELARIAAETKAETIVFCGVEFMAETAKILSPEKNVLIPSTRAGCSLAESIRGADVRALRERYPGVPIVCYVNTYADVKAECDAACTSSNAAAVVESFASDTVIFVPDKYLAANVARDTGKKIIMPTNKPVSTAELPENLEPTIIGWEGMCYVHDEFRVSDIENVRSQYPDVVVLAHPECRPEVVEASDFSGSTKAMINYVKDIEAPRYLLLTECAMGDNILAANPGKDILRMCSVRCKHMNTITLEQTRDALLHNQHQVHVDKDVAMRAKKALDYMLRIG
jgi:quinolinate synthase